MNNRTPPGRIDGEAFLNIIDATPLIAIDLVLRNQEGQVLLGKRTNRPALGYWFVPGGRILKNERLHEALTRIASDELGLRLDKEETALLGAYEHIYEDNFLGRDTVNTHYVVLAYQHTLSEAVPLAPDAQHSKLQWWGVDDLMDSNDVHDNTKSYFQ